MECINVAASKPLRNSTRHLMRLFDCIQSKRKQGTTRTIERKKSFATNDFVEYKKPTLLHSIYIKSPDTLCVRGNFALKIIIYVML